MPIGTSDGEHFANEMDYVMAGTAGFDPSAFRRSSNVEDSRTFADKWGNSFGPSEGGPPAGIDPREWYDPSMQKYSPIVRQAVIGATNQVSKIPQNEISPSKGLTSEEDLNWRDYQFSDQNAVITPKNSSDITK